MTSSLSTVLETLWQATWQAAVLAILVGAIVFVLRKRLTPREQQILWLIVFARLAMPVLPSSPTSAFALFGAREQTASPMGETSRTLASWRATSIDKNVIRHESRPTSGPARADLLPIAFVVLWLGGAMTILVGSWVSTVRLSRRLRSEGGDDRRLQSLLDAAIRPMPVWRRPLIVQTARVREPALIGVRRPMLLVPPSFSALPDRDIHAIFLHELRHVRGEHLLIDWILLTVKAIHWFNPIAWWAHAEVRRTRELICDAAVLGKLGPTSRGDYGQMLLRIAANRSRDSARFIISASLLGRQSALRERIELIAGRAQRKVAGLGIVLSVVLAICLLTKPTTAQPSTAPTSQPTSARDAAFLSDIPTIGPMLVLPDDEQHPGAERVSINFDGVPLKTVIEQISRQGNVPIDVDWHALNRAGLKEKQLVTVHVERIPLDRGIERVFKTASPGKRIVEMMWFDGTLSISTPEANESSIRTRVYVIQDLLLPYPEAKREEAAVEIVKSIQDTIARDTWKDHGGKLGTVQRLPGTLVITQSPRVHGMLERYFTSIRELTATQVDLETRWFEVPDATAADVQKRFTTDGKTTVICAQDANKLLAKLLATEGVETIGALRLRLLDGTPAQLVTADDAGAQIKLKVAAHINNDAKSLRLTTNAEMRIRLGADNDALVETRPSPQQFVDARSGEYILLCGMKRTVESPDEKETDAKGSGRTVCVLMRAQVIQPR